MRYRAHAVIGGTCGECVPAAMLCADFSAEQKRRLVQQVIAITEKQGKELVEWSDFLEWFKRVSRKFWEEANELKAAYDCGIMPATTPRTYAGTFSPRVSPVPVRPVTPVQVTTPAPRGARSQSPTRVKPLLSSRTIAEELQPLAPTAGAVEEQGGVAEGSGAQEMGGLGIDVRMGSRGTNDVFVVRGLAPAGAAAKQGVVQTCDEIEAVDGNPVAGLSLHEVNLLHTLHPRIVKKRPNKNKHPNNIIQQKQAS